ncbi:MAG TPA: DUF1552 domain-containing protein, partial [Pirellulaceae bacterium]|nr:DUF1552 domain-containing protein [Pirellulaceae bacterium]
MNRKPQISRRAVLKGLGVTVALPWLESVRSWAREAVQNDPAAAPKRFACLFQGDGISPPDWWAKGQGDAMELGPSLEALAPYKSKLNVLNGLFNRNAGGGHARCTGNILSGVALQRGRIIRGAASMDQLLAKQNEQESAVPSLVLGCEHPVSGFHESQYSMVYASHISWQNAESPVPIELYPSLAFDTLFGGKSGKLQGSILDHVLEQANDLRGKVSGSDRLKLDEYLSSVRETEQRVRKLQKQGGDDQQSKQRAAQRPADGLPTDLREYARAMCDMIAMAFQTDRTRVATLLLSRDLSGQVYPFLGIRDDHHSYSHSNTGPEYKKIVKFHVEQYAYLVGKLAAMQEGDRTVLDNSCILFISEHWDAHNSNQVPVVLAGGLGGALATGRSMDFLHAGNERRKLCSLYLALLDRMGIPLREFGDATERLAG